MKPTFLLLQTAFAAGLIRRSWREVENALDRNENAVFARQARSLGADIDDFLGRWQALAGDSTSAAVRDVLQLRLDAQLPRPHSADAEAGARSSPVSRSWEVVVVAEVARRGFIRTGGHVAAAVGLGGLALRGGRLAAEPAFAAARPALDRELR